MNPINVVTIDTKSALYDSLFLMPNWKWIALASALFVGFFLLQALRLVLPMFNKHLSARLPQGSWTAFFLAQAIHKPLSLILVSGLWLMCWEALMPPEHLNKILTIGTQALLSLGLLRLAYLGVEALGQVMQVYVRKTSHTMDDQLAPFATKSLKVLVVILGCLIIMQNFGVNVVSLLAGLGLGGLALALAAQDTAANLFGSITILLDRPFHVGDSIKIGDIEGTVEEIGFRSTRLRTLSKSLMTIPNSTMAKEKIDNLNQRIGRRFRHVIGLSYDAAPPQLNHFVDSVRGYLQQHPRVDGSSIAVAIQALNDSAIQMLVTCFMNVTDPNEELALQQEMLLKILAMAETQKIALAQPSQTLYHVLPPDPVASPAAPPAPPSHP